MGFVDLGEENRVRFEPRDDYPNDLEFTVEGNLKPFVEVTLPPGQAILCNVDALLLHDYAIRFAVGLTADGRRRLATNLSEDKAAKIVLTAAAVGKTGVFDLENYGNTLLVPEHLLLGFAADINATTYATYRSLPCSSSGNALSFIMLEGRGRVLVGSHGDVFERRLGPGEEVCVRARAVAALTATVDFDHMPWGNEPDTVTSMAKLTGPGTVWLQSSTGARPRAKPAQPSPLPTTPLGPGTSRKGNGVLAAKLNGHRDKRT